MTRWGLALVTLLAAHNTWEVRWTPNSAQVGVQVETQCWHGAALSFIAVDYIQVEEGESMLTFRRHNETPRGDACTVKAFVMGKDDSSPYADADSDYVIDNSEFVEQR